MPFTRSSSLRRAPLAASTSSPCMIVATKRASSAASGAGGKVTFVDGALETPPDSSHSRCAARRQRPSNAARLFFAGERTLDRQASSGNQGPLACEPWGHVILRVPGATLQGPDSSLMATGCRNWMKNAALP
jgi:hypothetical protein